MNNFTKILLSSLLCGVTLLSGCDKAPEPSEIVVSDGVSEPAIAVFPCESCGVTLKSAVQKAVSLSPAATEIICELGFEDRLVGISSYCDYPEGLSAKRVGSTENPDIDAIIELKPDAVFTLSPLSEREIYILGQEGINVLTAPMPSDLDGYSALYKEFSAAFYGKENTDDGIRRFEKIGADARAAVESAADGIEKGSFVYITGKETFAGKDTFESSVLGLIGENLCMRDGYVTLEDYWEELTEQSPAYIIAADTLTEQELRESATLTKLLETGSKLCFVSSQCFERPSARTAQVFEAIKSAYKQ